MEHVFPLQTGRRWSPQERWTVSLFGQSLIAAKAGELESAKFFAALCLGALGGPRSESYIYAGATETIAGQEVHLPDYLHYGTALEKFKEAGILTGDEIAQIAVAI